MNSKTQSLLKRYLESQPYFCTERARIATESYKSTEGEPAIIRAAKALDAVLTSISVWIDVDELIVGHWAGTLRGVPLWPEFGSGPPQLGFHHTPDRSGLLPHATEATEREMQELFSYWRGKSYTDRVCSILPERINQMRQASLWYWHLGVVGNRRGRYLVNLPAVLEKGFKGIRKEVERKLEEIDLEEPEAIKRQLFYRAIVVVCDSSISFVRRYAVKAKELAYEATGTRKKELEEIAHICEKVPANPAETLHEALQAAWFTFLIANIESGGDSISLGRLDRILYPYYERDIKKRRITKEKAKALLEAFLFRFGENSTAGVDLDSNVNGITIGGQTEYGEDATNEMTYMLLDALEQVRLPKPQFGMRVHKGTPRQLLMKAIDVMRATGGRPQLNNDDAIIPALVRCGVPLKEARDYAVDGCQHFTTYARKDHSAWFNLAKVLDLALNNGIDRLTGKQIGLPTGDPGRFTSLDGVISAFQKQLEHCIKMMSTESELVDALIRDMMCLPYASIHVKGCLERGAEVLAGGGYYNWTGMHGTGIATVANSLAAMKKVIFEEKKFSVLELTKALDKNFIGFEELRQDLIQAPKWGNDDDYVDSLAVKVANLFLDEADKHKCRANPANPGPSIAGFHSLTFNEGFGEATAATPDGRKTGERLSDGIAPSVGTYQGGPTAVFLSAAKLDHARSWTASLTLTLDGSTEVLADLSRTYLTDMGGKHLMGNLICPDILLDAKKHPEKYRDMLVRVAGFSARFVELPENMQDLVIRRATVGA